MDKQDRVIKTTVEQREMAILVDGKRIPVKGKVIQTYWESGKIDAHVEMEKPLSLSGEAHDPNK